MKSGYRLPATGYQSLAVSPPCESERRPGGRKPEAGHPRAERT
jgi:hypothetical protein